MRRLQRRRLRQQEVVELNVTAFMNLMVVLVPFLLMMAVFSRITIHELSVPNEAASDGVVEEELQLEVAVHADRLVLSERSGGHLVSLSRNEKGHDLSGLRDWLIDVKARNPEVDHATILVAADVRYEDLVQVMDQVRLDTTSGPSPAQPRMLFPDIALGDAPLIGMASPGG